MKFQHFDLGSRTAGETVQINLSGNAANVQLMDSSNFQSYRSGRSYRCIGGHVKRSPVRFTIPHSGHWHVAIDLGGFVGSVRSSVEILPAPYRLPEINQAPLSSVPSLVHNTQPGTVQDESTTLR